MCDGYSDCDNNEDENEAICKGKRAVLPKQTCLRVRVVLITEDSIVTVKCRTAIKAMYRYFELCQSVKYDSPSCSFTMYIHVLSLFLVVCNSKYIDYVVMKIAKGENKKP